MLQITNLQASFEQTPILKGVHLQVPAGQLHVIMGPNGSGKSTLGKVLLAHPHYEHTAGKIIFDDQDFTGLSTSDRAKAGVFLSHQSPPAIAGVSAHDLLRAAEKANAPTGQRGRNVVAFKRDLSTNLHRYGLSKDFIDRSIHQGASGGERKKMEIVSLLMLGAKLAFLDEIDSGLDVDALKNIVQGIQEFLADKTRSVILITHNEKILELLSPQVVHIFCNGRIVHSGGQELWKTVHQDGFDAFEACKTCTIRSVEARQDNY